MNEGTYKWPMALGIVIVAAVLAYALLTMKDQRSPIEKVGDAIHDLPQGLDKAGQQLESRTPAEVIQDEIKDKQ